MSFAMISEAAVFDFFVPFIYCDSSVSFGNGFMFCMDALMFLNDSTAWWCELVTLMARA